MIIKFDECNFACNELFQDMINASKDGAIDIAKWAKNICDGKSGFHPLDFWITGCSRAFCLISAGQVDPAAPLMLKELKKLPYHYRYLPNDYCEIRADAFEKELYIDLNHDRN